MTEKLPYLTAPGLVPKILGKIQEAKRPDRFTQDFLDTKLGFSGGSAKAIIPLLKRMEFLNPDGTPTALYNQLRNNETQGYAAARGIQNAYSPIFDRNEYAGDLSKEKLKSLMMEITGAAHDDRVLELQVSTFEKLKEFADFDPVDLQSSTAGVSPAGDPETPVPATSIGNGHSSARDVGLNVAYNINIVLPETTNPEVIDNIIRSIRDNLLKSS